QLLQNPAAHAKILHTVSVCYATAAATVMAISAWILKDNTVKGNSHSGRSKTDRDRQSQFLEPQHSLSRDSDVFALYSFRSAAVMGLMSMLLVCIGDATPHLDTPTQNIKLAALTGSELAVLLPKLETKINNGIKAFSALQDLRDENKDTQLLAEFNRYSPDLGYAFLLKLWTEHVDEASAEQKELAEQFCLPAYPGLLFLMNRGMIAVGIIMLLLFAAAILISRDKSAQPPWLCKLSIYLSPLPWFACIGGWYIAIGGMQPWAVAGLIPVFLSVSSLTPINLIITLAVNCAVYALLLFIGIILIRRVITLPNTTITSGLQP
ncbi:MAG: cytochrome ubiquinol oxidase subunit I, partial [Methylomonas sp.]